MTTGNLYLQVYNPALNKYLEIPKTVGSIEFITSPTGFTSYDTTRSFSGFYFSRPVKINKSIEMMPINIGANNKTGNVIFSINIGAGNNDIFTRSSYINAKAVSAINLGILNGATDSTFSTNLGMGNSLQNAQTSLNLGESNYISGSYKTLNVGFGNSINTGDYSFIFGFGNYITSGYNVVLLGTENSQLTNISDSNILGSSNTTKNVNLLNSFGSSNTFIDLNSSFNLGNHNNYNNSKNITILNNDNTISGSNDEIILGDFNSLIKSSQDIIVGSNNAANLSRHNNIIGSNNSLISGSSNDIYASSNSLLDSDSNYIAGRYNSASGLFSSVVLGKNNSFGQSIINKLYKVELTGITGKSAGQTPFTGFTGYSMLKYVGVPGSGGKNNFIVGNLNETSLNQNSYIFGGNNQVLNNSNSYIFGSNNYLEESSSSFAFGSENSISGVKNYVIGNNNSVRSGDYNSILIGISHEFTGSYKIASINIASVDSNIEVSPSQINLTSPNRPKINGENIIIQSEFDTIADSLKQNGPVFATNKFKDSNYDKLADNIFLSNFTYNSGASSSLTFDATNFGATSSLFLNKFNIFGPTSYTGQGGFNVIYGNHTNSKFSPAWIVVDNSTSGVYYKNDITPFNITPQSGWHATGFRDGDGDLLYTGTSVNFGADLVIGSKQGYMSVSTASFGTMYVPFFY
jgi:hypothetical protein